jgi:CheY-like chemotaxis protein
MLRMKPTNLADRVTASLNRILLVDDSPTDVELTLAALARHHLANQVVVARDGEEALNYLYRRGLFVHDPPGLPAMILLDIKMPKIDGLEVLRQLKADPALSHIPVVILTSSRESPDRSACYRLGITSYVTKPVDFHDLVEAVKHIGVFWAMVNQPGAEPASNAQPAVAS